MSKTGAENHVLQKEISPKSDMKLKREIFFTTSRRRTSVPATKSLDDLQDGKNLVHEYTGDGDHTDQLYTATKPSNENSIDELVSSVTLYNSRPLLYHGYVGPFIVLYPSWLILWVYVYGVWDYFEAGWIALALLGILQILTSLFCHWSVEIRCLLTCKKIDDPFHATLVKVIPTPNNGSPELVLLHFRKDEEQKSHIIMWFMFQKTKYIYNFTEKTFHGLEFPEHYTFKHYRSWTGYENDEDYELAQSTFGKNDLEMVAPDFMELFKERATAPFFVFQVFCVGLWCLDEFWYYSLFTLAMLIAFECTLVQQQLRNLSEIRNMGSKPFQLQVYRYNKWRPISSKELIPGDLISIGRSQNDSLIPCDLLLLRGSCIVDESMLTGESVPQMKESVEDLNPNDVFDNNIHGRMHVLYGGTKVLQHTPPGKNMPGIKAPDNGCVAYVIRNSFCTYQGKLLRTILFGVKRVTANNLETFCFILFLLIFAIAAASYVWIKGTEDPKRNRYKLFLECTLIITSVVPPELPIELSLAVNTSLLALSKLYIYCTEPFRIPFAGKVEICCFDKTGTLTSDRLVVEGVAGLKDRKKICSMADIPIDTLQVLATCHSLMYVDSRIVGDPVEKATLLCIQWNLTKGDAVVPKKGKISGFKICHRFHFTSTLKRMSVIASYIPVGNFNPAYIVTVKGAPEMLKTMLTNIPDDYDDVYIEMTRQGARVLALGRKLLGFLSYKEVRDLTRADTEENLEFAGFLVISCPLKPDSKAVVKEVQQASHHVMMITGDAPLTACHVAKELDFTKHEKTLILTYEVPPRIISKPSDYSNGADWNWLSVDETVCIPYSHKENLEMLHAAYDLCITGKGLAFLHKAHYSSLRKLLPHICVFARVEPKHKEYIITELKNLGFVTLMCGDGTNDVGALKHADVGVAILTERKVKSSSKTKRSKDNSYDEKDAENTDTKKPAMISSKGKLPHRQENRNKGIPRGGNLGETQKKLQKLLQEMEEQEPSQIVKLGDASIAAPFTAKHSSTECICHIVKQGRCTLVTTLQMFKILALNALIFAYSQSVLYLDGIKFSDMQATLQGLLLAGCFLFISRSKPLKTLSSERPLPNIFNVYTILTVLLQFVVHFCCLIFLVTEASARMPERTEKFADLEAEFKPSLLNSAVYIISIALQLCTFAVNYRGHPFMENFIENKPLLLSIVISSGAIIFLVTGWLPELANTFSIVEFEPEFQKIILITLALDFLLSFVIDRICLICLGKGKLKKL